MARGALPLEQTLRYGIEISDALNRAHRFGIVHRDLKPGNVLLTSSGVKLLDFGLAKVLTSASSSGALTALPTEAPPLTKEGTILGTFQYMAPEQLEGKEADARTDIFAFGMVLYEMATGRKAFTGSTQASLIGAILHTQPTPISSIEPMSPPALDRVVQRCVAKDPERRWQSARDVGLELEEVGKETDAPIAPAARRRRPLAALLGWAVAVLLLAAGLLFAPWRGRGSSSSLRLRFVVPPPAGSALQGMLALSPDARKLAFVAAGGDGRDLVWVRPLDSLEARALAGTDGATYPFWSPDGQSIAFFAQGKLKRIDPSGGSARTLCDAAGARGGSWGSRGTIVFAVAVGGQMKVVGESGGEPRSLAHLTSRAGEVYRWPTFLPDGNHFLYFALLGGADRTGVWVGSVDSGEKKSLALADSGAIYVPPGHLLYRNGDRLLRQSFDPVRLRATGDAVPLVEDVWWDGISTLATAFSASGDVLAYQTGGLVETRVLLYERSGRELAALGPPGQYAEPALSPDGRWLAIIRIESGARLPQVWIIDLERGGLSRVSSQTSFSPATPLWSSDGRQIAYALFPTGEVYVRDAQGVEKEKLLYKSPSFAPLDDWSRDGRYLFREVIDSRTFHFDVALRDLKTGADRPVLTATFNQSGARLSPDGRWLAYESQESGATEIVVRSFPGAGDRRQVSVGGGSQPRWRGDGKELFFVSPDRKIMSVEVRNAPAFEAGAPRALFQTRILPAVEARNHYDVTSDGQRFVVNSRRPDDALLPITAVTGWMPERR